MKTRTTQKNIRNSFKLVVSAPYCALQHVLAETDPIAYTAGKCGWNADVYDVGGGTAIVTGYRPFGEKIDRDFFVTWDEAAQKAVAAGGSLAEIVQDMAGALRAMLAPPNAATIAKIADVIAVAEKMATVYYSKSSRSAGVRHYYEKYYSRPAVEWREGGHSYSAAFFVFCGCNDIYAYGSYYRDGVKTTLTVAKKSLERLTRGSGLDRVDGVPFGALCGRMNRGTIVPK